AWTAFVPVEQGRVAGTDVEQVQRRVVHHAVPYRAAATDVPAAVGVPGGRGQFQFRMFEPFGGVARHRKETPAQLATFAVIGADIAARIVIGTRVAYYHHLARHFRRAAGGIGAILVDKGVLLPAHRAG